MMDNTYDKMYYGEGALIAGIDESGVSDIAGPLVAACVILPKIDIHKDDLRIFEIDDSKKIPEKYRDKHAEIIWQTAIGIGLGEVQPAEFDYLGRVEATRLAMYRAVSACKTTAKGKEIKPDFILLDRVQLNKRDHLRLPVKIRQAHIDQGDTKSLCIAAASIIAKVYRDKIMIRLHEKFPHYNWISNKGYPCEDHYKGIDVHGIQFGIHRIKKWPFRKNPSLQEDHVWDRRRDQWRRITASLAQKEAGKEIWTPRQ